jgi:hypothetical protein
LVDKKGKAIDGQATFRMRHFMGDEGKVFDLIVQRSVVTGQVELDLALRQTDYKTNYKYQNTRH